MDDESQEESATSTKPKLWKRFLSRFIIAMLVAIPVATVWFLIDNNYSFSGKTAEQFESELDRSLELGMQWLVENRETFEKPGANSALMHMLRDMHEPVQYPLVEEVVTNHLERRSPRNFWRRLIEPDAKTVILLRGQLLEIEEYKRWLAYAIAPDDIQLTSDEYANMFEPTKHWNRDLTHQLMALDMLRDLRLSQGPNQSEDPSRPEESPENIDSLIDALCKRVATGAVVDFRVTDIYLQRVASVLAAGRPDLIKKRWIERIIGYQSTDGGFYYSWYGWGPNPVRFFDFRKPSPHATIQGIWAMYMIRHRYPEWIEENYPGS